LRFAAQGKGGVQCRGHRGAAQVGIGRVEEAACGSQIGRAGRNQRRKQVAEAAAEDGEIEAVTRLQQADDLRQRRLDLGDAVPGRGAGAVDHQFHRQRPPGMAGRPGALPSSATESEARPVRA